MNKSHLNEDPRRLTRAANEGGDIHELVDAFVDNLVHDPADVHKVIPAHTGDIPRVVVEFHNTVGGTCAVDGIIERFNMFNWRTICDKFLEKALERIGRNPEGYNWPTPHPRVTLIPEDGGTDVIETVCLDWTVDKDTWNAVNTFAEHRRKEAADRTEEETCCNCDVQIKYIPEIGKIIVTCPECGTIQPICGGCELPEHDGGACDRCSTHLSCKVLNSMRVEVKK